MSKNSKLPGWPDMLQPPFANLAAGFGQGAGHAGASPGLAGGMDFMKGLWGGLPSSVPGFVLPTLDIGELDKRIEDLRSVESWLALNANMLKATIQGLEVQRNTLAALQALRDKGDFLSAMMRPASENAAGTAQAATKDDSHEPAPPAPSPEQAKSKSAFADAFRQSFGAGAGNPNWPLPLEASPAPPESHAPDDEAPPYVAPPKVKKNGRKKAHKGRAKLASSHASEASVMSASAAQSANLWMNFLKDQFGQIASAALLPKSPASATKSLPSKASPALKTATKASARPAAKRPAKAAKARPARRAGSAVKTAPRRQISGAKG